MISTLIYQCGCDKPRLATAAPFLPAAGEPEKSQAGTGGREEPAQAGHELDDPASG